jgi:CubicO group peptidase (beta-lactamase class C family)
MRQEGSWLTSFLLQEYIANFFIFFLLPNFASMKQYIRPRNIIIVLLLIIVLFILSQPYLRRALWYTTAGIEDYTIFENRTVQAGQPQPWPKHAEYNKKAIPVKFMQELKQLHTVAYVVIQDGKLLHEEYWEGYNDHSLSNSFSVAKTVVSLLVGIAIDEGKIKSVDQKVGDFMPHYREGRNAGLTIKDVLTMSSGLDWDESYFNPFSVTTKAYYGDDLPSLIAGLNVVETPGKQFKYLSGNTQILALILEKATGMKISEYASKKLWQPLGAEHNALWSLDHANGTEKAYCCLNSNATDFARLGQLILNKGNWNGQQLISKQYMEEATHPASYLIDAIGNPVDFYGYQFWIIKHKGMQIPYARGILGQYILALPERNAVVVRLGKERAINRVGEHPTDVLLYTDAALSILDHQ